jgi:hypothetical protein
MISPLHTIQGHYVNFTSICMAFLTVLGISINASAAEQRVPVAASVKKVVEARLPSGSYITAIDLDQYDAALKGAANSASDVSQLMRNLQGTAGIEKVELVEISSQSTNAGFSLKLTLTCAEEKAGQNAICRQPAPAKVTHKCKINGQWVYQDRPCPQAAGSKS